MNPEQTLNAPPLTSTGRLRVAEEHARACWDKLVEHAKGGRCTCHLGAHGSVHVLNACYTGRMLQAEYFSAAERVRELSPPIQSKLEPGDMESMLDYPSQDELDAADRTTDLPL